MVSSWFVPHGMMHVILLLAFCASACALSTGHGAAFVQNPVSLRKFGGHATFTQLPQTRASWAKSTQCRKLNIRASSTTLSNLDASVTPGQEPEEVDVVADDGHKIKVWMKGPKEGRNVVLLHGRTWSARPVWDLQVGDPPRDGSSLLGASTMDLMASLGIRTFAPDMRGLGGTVRDEPGFTTPNRCVDDVKCVLNYLKEMEGVDKPILVGWSQGALVAQLFAQDNAGEIKGLVLYATIFDKNHKYPIEEPPEVPPVIMNTMEGAMEDWTVPGLIDDEAANAFGEECLKWNARKVSWARLHEFNALDAAKVTVPTLVIHGENDMYTDVEKQRDLFMDLGAKDKTWKIVSDADHPVHLYPSQRRMWVSTLMGFFEGLDAH